MPFEQQDQPEQKRTEQQDAPQRKRGTRQGTAQKAAPATQPRKGSSDAKIRRKRKRTFGAAQAPFVRQKTTWIGDLLYNLGFYGEYYIVQIGRVLREAGIFLGQVLAWMFGGFFGKLAGFFVGLAQDLVSPITRHRQAKLEEQDEDRQARPGEKRPNAAKSLLHFLANLVKMALPVAATVVLVYTVYSVFSMNYALAVEVEGEVIGYVSDETVLEDAQDILKDKIELAPNQSLSEWQFTPVLSISTSDTLSNKNQIADEILRTSDEVDYAYGVRIDGTLVGVAREGDQLLALLQSMKDQYYDPETPDAVIDFVNPVEVSDDDSLFFTESIMSFEELKAMLTSNQSEAVYHTADGEETLSEIAQEGNITMDTLQLRNPDYEGMRDTYKPEAGTSLLIQRAVPYLQVQKAFLQSEEQVIPHETEEEPNENLPQTRRNVKVQGEDGKQIVYYDLVYVDGELVQTVPREDLTQVIQAPVTEVVEVGTFTGGGDLSGQGGFGDYAFPLPDVTGMSRGFLGAAHRGLDLNAPAGTPVYSSNAGVVIEAGWHWSYGNYVMIEHQDGIVTLYAHNSALYVSAGDQVGRLALIAAVGSTGVSTGNHCHFEVQVNGVQVDPLGFVQLPAILTGGG